MGTHLRVLNESYQMNTNYQHDSVQMVFLNICVYPLGVWWLIWSIEDNANKPLKWQKKNLPLI